MTMTANQQIIDNDDELLFDDDTETVSEATNTSEDNWKVLIVDDDLQIHRVTKFALQDFAFEGRGITLDSAYSGSEAMDMLSKQEYAVTLLDVVMEADHAGLEVVNFIRKKLNNTRTRIILRTGQPGMAPEKQVVQDYDIDDYRSKADLSADKLFTAICTSLRNFRERLKIDAIVAQRTQEVVEKNNQIMESIFYAQRIQNAILPEKQYISQFIPNYEIFFQPKDVVSGDFYFFSRLNDSLILANIDCTGHGVPGAIMSIFAYNLLSLTVNHMGMIDGGVILNELDIKLQELLHQEGKDVRILDGMDMALIILNPKQNRLNFASANHTLFIARNNEIIEYSGNRFPIGAYVVEKKKFDSHTIQYEQHDVFYLFTDGIVDQFGGPEKKKFSSKRLKSLIQEQSKQPISQQIANVKQAFFDWKGDYEQTDDVSFMVFAPPFNL
jgi:serine phosphatase RsbU (regulator of sigma subunit)